MLMLSLRQRERQLTKELRSVRKQIGKQNRVVRGLGPKRIVRGSGDRDEALKASRGYSDPSSFVRHDGSEVLKGEDWKQRKEQLRLRSGGKCEMYTVLGLSHSSWCEGLASEPHHIVRRSIKRDDRMTNLAYLSHACH